MLGTRCFPYAAALRWELSLRNQTYAHRLGLACRQSLGEPPVVCYLTAEDSPQHGNFLPQSYQAILKNPDWSRRLRKPHTSALQALPREGLRWRELDSSTSSDALLMNIFCFPATLRKDAVLRLLGVEPGVRLDFGFKARVPLTNGRRDRTEVDMRLGHLQVEAKLTESDFQRAPAKLVEGYRDFSDVFAPNGLPMSQGCYDSYQLIRNVLAAHASGSAFCVMMDARRPDLREAWFAIISCIRVHDLRLRCQILTWQELAAVLPARLQKFLEEKYGIAAGVPRPNHG